MPDPMPERGAGDVTPDPVHVIRRHSEVALCPKLSLLPSHYRSDGSCLCVDPPEGVDDLLSIQQAADILGIEYQTARAYHGRAMARRKRGFDPKPGDWPEEDRRVGKTPAWFESTIRRFEANRPGQGAGGGRPPRREEAS